MNKSILTPEFYNELYAAMVDAGKDGINGLYAEDIIEGKSVPVDGYVNCGFYFTANVSFSLEYVDESFDHEFGTWHDPNPYYEVIGCEEIADVHIYEDDDKDSKEIEGFSMDDFLGQFEVESYGSYHKGDKVTFGRNNEGTVAAYNKELGKLKVISNDNTYYIETKYVKKVTAA